MHTTLTFIQNSSLALCSLFQYNLAHSNATGLSKDVGKQGVCVGWSLVHFVTEGQS